MAVRPDCRSSCSGGPAGRTRRLIATWRGGAAGLAGRRWRCQGALPAFVQQGITVQPSDLRQLPACSADDPALDLLWETLTFVASPLQFRDGLADRAGHQGDGRDALPSVFELLLVMLFVGLVAVRREERLFSLGRLLVTASGGFTGRLSPRAVRRSSAAFSYAQLLPPLVARSGRVATGALARRR